MQYHQQAAKLLEDRFPEVASTQPELVAHHYTEANCPAQAIAYWLKAGTAAASKWANLEAINQFGRGLALVEALSDMRERAERELDLQMALGPALFATKVSSDADVGRTYSRAWELCQQHPHRAGHFGAGPGVFPRARAQPRRGGLARRHHRHPQPWEPEDRRRTIQ
jgi:predicted ATPase